MTPEEKHIFQLFPENETVRQQDILIKFLLDKGKRFTKNGFTKVVKKLMKTEVLEHQGTDDDAMYLRRRTTEEIREIYFNK